MSLQGSTAAAVPALKKAVRATRPSGLRGLGAIEKRDVTAPARGAIVTHASNEARHDIAINAIA